MTNWKRLARRGAFLAVLFAATGAAAQGSVESDRAALEALYHATDGPNWSDNTNWLTDRPLGFWYGVSTGGGGRPVGLRLGQNDLTGGPIPAAIGDLTNLEELDLSGNPLRPIYPDRFPGLSGPIPAAIGDLTNLEVLILYFNNLSGPIPAAIGDLTNLEALILDQNSLSGPIPHELAALTNLYRLRIDRDTGLCLPAGFPESPFRRLALGIGVPDCDVVPALPWPAVFALGGALMTAGLARLRWRGVTTRRR